MFLDKKAKQVFRPRPLTKKVKPQEEVKVSEERNGQKKTSKKNAVREPEVSVEE